MRIVLIGYMGSGKSTVGRQLAAELGLDFTDLDHYIEAEEGQTIPEIFKQRGEIYFRRREHELLQQFLDKHESGVLALGGGTPCYSGNMDRVLEASPNVFYLKLPVMALNSRLQTEKAARPLIAHLSDEELPEFIGKHLFERSPFYSQSHFIIEAEKKDVATLVAEISGKLV